MSASVVWIPFIESSFLSFHCGIVGLVSLRSLSLFGTYGGFIRPGPFGPKARSFQSKDGGARATPLLLTTGVGLVNQR